MSRTSDWRHYIPRVFAILLTLLGLFCAIEAIGSAFRSGLRPLRDVLDAVLIPNNGNLAYAAVVFLLAAAIARRKRIAWRIILWVTCVQLALAVVAFIVVAVSPGTFTNAQGETVHRGTLFAQTSAAVVVAGAILAVLILGRREFYALVRHASFRRAVLVTLGLLGAGVLLGWGLVAIFPGTLAGGAGTRLLYSASRVLGGTVRFTSRDLGDAPGAVNLILGLFGAIAILVGFSTLLSSQRAEATLPRSDEERIRGLLAKTGERDSLGYFATRRDKSAIFSPSGKAAVTYRVVNGVSLASADPIGDPEAWGPAVDAWIEQARAYAWVPAAMGASEEGAIAYQRAGLKVVELGDEAILHTNEFTLDGRDMRPVRQAVNRLERADYTVRVSRHDDLSPEATPRSSTRPTTGATRRANAVFRWRSVASATRPMASACSSRRLTATAAARRCCPCRRGAAPVSRSI
jgi:lysyl-tRNA synthetase class 2